VAMRHFVKLNHIIDDIVSAPLRLALHLVDSVNALIQESNTGPFTLNTLRSVAKKRQMYVVDIERQRFTGV